MAWHHDRARRWAARSMATGCLLSVALVGADAGWRHLMTRRGLAVAMPVHEQTLSRVRDEGLARRARDRDREAAERASHLAGLLVDHVSVLRRRLPLGAEDREAHGRARMALSEARFLLAGGIHAQSVARAAEARDLAAGVFFAAVDTLRRYEDPVELVRWQAWIGEAVDASRRTGRAVIVVSKAAHRVTVYEGGRIVRTYPGDLGVNWVLDKARAGDGATPEGRYRVTEIRHRGSAFYKALLLDYPNDLDRRVFVAAQQAGRLPGSVAIGGDIAIHGHGGRGEDWTDGCVALSNSDLDDLIARVEPGASVVIVGASRADEMAERLGVSGGHDRRWHRVAE